MDLEFSPGRELVFQYLDERSVARYGMAFRAEIFIAQPRPGLHEKNVLAAYGTVTRVDFSRKVQLRPTKPVPECAANPHDS